MGTSDTLRSVIDAGRSSKRLDELSSARVIGKIALQIHAAQQKVGHGKAVGPITPAHIKLASTGEATLELGDASTLGYSSPEQIAGTAADRRSDVFSVGAVLWEALTHARLFDAMNDAAVRVAVQEREIVPPAEINANVPPELSAICMRALSRNPADRYQSLKVMAVEIEEFLEEAGYEDSDAKIAQYLAAMREPPKQVKIAMAPLARPATATPAPPIAEAASSAPPPAVPAASAPSMLGEPPAAARAKRASGADLAAALAGAGAPTPATTATGSLPPASAASTAVGVPKLGDLQDSTPPEPAVPARSDKQTIVGAVPMPKVMVDASYADAKQPAVIVDDKPKAVIVDDKPKAVIVDDKPMAVIVDTPPPGALAAAAAQATDAKAPALLVETPPLGSPAQTVQAHGPVQLGFANGTHTPPPGKLETMTTLVDTKPPDIEVPKLVDGKLPESALPSVLKPSAVETVPVPAVAPVATAVDTADVAKPLRAKSQSEGRAPSQAPSSSEASSAQATRKSAPHPASAVSLGPGPTGKDSKDVLAGWGWGTDKHDAIPPEAYDDGDYDVPHASSKKILTYVVGGGLALAALVTIIAIGFGGSSKQKSASLPPEVPTQPAIDRAAPPSPAAATTSTDPAEATGSADPAAATPTGSADPAAAAPPTGSADPAAATANTDALASEPSNAEEAARLAAEQEAAKQELAKQELAKQELAKQEAAKQEAARLAAEAKAVDEQRKRDEASRIAAEKKAADDAKKAEAARIAADKKAQAEQQRVADARKAEQARKEQARLAKATTKTTAKPATKTAKTTSAKTAAKPQTETTAKAKADAEIAYRIGVQLFARGDTKGALSHLRTALAGNPTYAPTWRGLGLVFEKMGERDQARAAFKRYLQLAPSAGDAQQIRSRLERLGS